MRVTIVGFGIVGKSMLNFLKNKLGYELSVWDSRSFTEQEILTISSCGAKVLSSNNISLKQIVEYSDLVLVSPGVNMNDYKDYSHKIVCEMDLLKETFKLFTIGVTGSLGKTTTVKILHNLIKLFKSVTVGGNIGVGMLDLIQEQEKYEMAILELSSFQLEFSKKWSPDIAILLNCFENHLDRHNSLEEYIKSKLNIVKYQNSNNSVIISGSFFDKKLEELTVRELSNVNSNLYLLENNNICEKLLKRVPRDRFNLFFIDSGYIFFGKVQDSNLVEKSSVCSIDDLPNVTFTNNWLSIFAVIHALGLNLDFVCENKNKILLNNNNRCEFVATISDVDFYNDSKATIVQATEAAVLKFFKTGRPIILILGGLGKGVDRSVLIDFLKNINTIKKIYCFGPACDFICPTGTSYKTLDMVMDDIVNIMSPGDIVLFSPSGTSFDLYKNYEVRGDEFKKLVFRLKERFEA